jgi:hypothetical protein
MLATIQYRLPYHLLSKNINIRICNYITLPVVPYGCETWYLKLREEHILREFENMVLRRMFVPERERERERKLHNDEV